VRPDDGRHPEDLRLNSSAATSRRTEAPVAGVLASDDEAICDHGVHGGDMNPRIGNCP
jgi:hypothetical protein